MGRAANDGECPFVGKRNNTNGGQNPYQCFFCGKDVSSDEYYHLCRYDQKAVRECPMRSSDYNS
ncbi:MAG: hypothetical protein Q4E53_13020 [Eubacteriales bacterium]|nr:hypothetical protein [Eubacteriales bacterium]